MNPTGLSQLPLRCYYFIVAFAALFILLRIVQMQFGDWPPPIWFLVIIAAMDVFGAVAIGVPALRVFLGIFRENVAAQKKERRAWPGFKFAMQAIRSFALPQEIAAARPWFAWIYYGSIAVIATGETVIRFVS